MKFSSLSTIGIIQVKVTIDSIFFSMAIIKSMGWVKASFSTLGTSFKLSLTSLNVASMLGVNSVAGLMIPKISLGKTC